MMEEEEEEEEGAGLEKQDSLRTTPPFPSQKSLCMYLELSHTHSLQTPLSVLLSLTFPRHTDHAHTHSHTLTHTHADTHNHRPYTHSHTLTDSVSKDNSVHSPDTHTHTVACVSGSNVAPALNVTGSKIGRAHV